MTLDNLRQNHIVSCSVCWNLITEPCMTLTVPSGNDIFNHAQEWKTEYQPITVKKDLRFISTRGNTLNAAIFKSMVVSVCTVWREIFH